MTKTNDVLMYSTNLTFSLVGPFWNPKIGERMYSVLGWGVVGILVCFDFTLCSSFVFVVLTVIFSLFFLLFRALVSRVLSLCRFSSTLRPFLPPWPPRNQRWLGIHEHRMAQFKGRTLHLGWGQRYAAEEVGEEDFI